MPTFVQKLVWTVRQIAPCQGWNSVDYLAKSGFRVLYSFQSCSERFFRSLAFNCNSSDVPCALNEGKILFGWNSRFVRVERESSEHFVILCDDRLGPRSSNAVPNRKVAILIGPVRVCRDIRNDDPFFQERCSPASSSFSAGNRD